VATDSAQLSSAARALLDDRGQQVYFSVASIWEVVIKSALGCADFRVDVDRLRTGAKLAGFEELPIRGPHVLAVVALPPLHADPFDRILIAQVGVERMRLLTVDRAVLAYGEPALAV
jgi:PIN domain nuclease of toxin-antitoxin system